MPTALVLNGPRALAFKAFPHAALAPDEVRIRTLLSAISAGTELTQYPGTSPLLSRRFDPATGRFVQRAEPATVCPAALLAVRSSCDLPSSDRPT